MRNASRLSTAALLFLLASSSFAQAPRKYPAFPSFVELPLVTATGREIWVLAQGQVDWQDGAPVQMVGALQDVTEHHRAAVELEHNRQRLRALYESTPALMHSVDVTGRVLSVSDRWLERLGYRREEVIGRMLDDFLTPESSRQLHEVYRPTMWRDGHVDDCPIQLICADGRLRDVLVSAVAEYDALGRPLRAQALVDDITEELQRRAELAQEQQMRRQTEQQRIGASGVQIVNQQAHAHAALGGIAQCAQQVAAGRVVVDHVVLHVERHLRTADQLDTCRQRLRRPRQQPKAAARAIRRRGERDAAEVGVG